MHAKRLILLLVLPFVVAVACGDSNNSVDTGPGPVITPEAGAPEVSSATDLSYAQAAPDAAVCNQLSSAARAQVQSYVRSISSLACQVDSDCYAFYPNSPACFLTCGGEPVRTADVYAVIDATASVCDAYFGAGCPAVKPVPCPYSRAFCDHGTCATGLGPVGQSGSPDAAVEAGTGVGGIDGGSTSDVKDSALEDASAIVDGGVCTWPANFTPTSAGSAVGCWAHAIAGAIDAGQFNCGSFEYALSCVGDTQRYDSGCQVRTMPVPDSLLGCRLLPLPTTANSSYYCCPCGQSQASLADARVSLRSACP